MAAAIDYDQEPIQYAISRRTDINEHYRVVQYSYGDMLLNAHDPLVEGSLKCALAEIEDLCQYARGVVIDVGANVGSHSINFARVADLVYAFEPQPFTYYNLCANLLLNLVKNVMPFNLALGSYCGSNLIANLDPTKPNTAMGVHVGEGTLPIPMRTLDSFEISPVHFIKIDVEGHELEVLKGALETLKRERLIVYVEIHKTELVEPIIKFMTELGYESMEHLSQYTREKGKVVHLTTGYLFWKPDRIKWISS